ncbi:MAG TPA: hypothetical protein VMJ10_21570 [Kofleriaceae bacterium]|nr:hypothetical protein [Kofleriaceae bacterium]
MRWLVLLALLGVAAGCKARPNCPEIAKQIAVAIGQSKVVEIVNRRCSDDHWDREAVECLLAVHGAAELSTCEGAHMEPSQAQRLRDDLAKLATTPTVLDVTISADDHISADGQTRTEAQVAEMVSALPPHSQLVLHVAGKTNRPTVIHLIDRAQQAGATSSITAEP